MDIPELPNPNNKPNRKPLDLVTPNYEPSPTIDELRDKIEEAYKDGVPTSEITTTSSELQDLKDKYAERYEAMFGSDADAAERVRGTIREQINDVASRLVNIATNSPNERLAADAAKYLLDRTVFRAGETDDDLAKWLKKLAGTENKIEKNAVSKGRTKVQLTGPLPENPDDPAYDAH